MSSNDIHTDAATIDYDPFADAALARVVPSTESQREIWLAAKLEPGASLAYNEAISLRLSGQLDVARLLDALQKLVDRHESLRGTLSLDGQQFCIAEHVDLKCEARNLCALDAATREEEIAAALRRSVDTPFELESGPLLRAELLRLDDQDHLLVITAHHIVCDGWSWGVIVKDLARLYRGDDGATLPPADSFGDFALAQVELPDADDHRADEAYWLGRFADNVPSLDLPSDRPRPRRRTFTSRREDRTLDASLVAQIKAMGVKHNASLYAALLATFGVLLQRLSGQDDVVIGIPLAGQAAGGHNALVGHCVNILPLRATIDPQSPFTEVLTSVRSDLLDAVDHQRYTFGTLLQRLSIARDPSRLPLVSVLFNLDQALDEATAVFPELRFELQAVPRTFENFELFINAVQVNGALRLECQYNSDLFDPETVRRWLGAYETLLRAAASSEGTAVAALPIVSAAELDVLRNLQPIATPFERDILVSDAVLAQAQRTPQRLAVRSGAVRWSYGDLTARAHAIAHTLHARGIEPGALVGVCLERGPDMLAALLGVLEVGAAYVPLDPAYPRDRLNYMAQDAQLSLLVSQSSLVGTFDWPPERSLLLDAAGAIDPAATAPVPRTRTVDAESVAYVIYTSGSTGKPKGVCVPHRAVLNFLASMRRKPGLAADDRFVAVTTLSFDIATLELFLPLTVGAEVVLATREQATDGRLLADLLDASAATAMQATPATWRMLMEAGWQGTGNFKVLCGGETLSIELAAQLLQRCASLWNMYGPTETTVWSTCAHIESAGQGISIGQPIDNTQVWILNSEGQPCPIGVPGEIAIGGEGVSLGYLRQPGLTAERFIDDPFAKKTDARLYRTGDRGRWRNDGRIEHSGRIDFQVKVRGYRIELGEIEANLSAHADVARAVAITREDRPGDVRLVAYVVARHGAVVDESTLHAHLKQSLPDYMVPQHIVVLDSIPLLPNGKVDRKALPAPQRQSSSPAERVAPRNEIERRVATAMEEVLALPELGIHDDFFALGGHSLLAAQLTARLNREFEVALSFRTLFDAPTIAGLATAIGSELASGESVKSMPIARRPDQTRAPLSLMQQRLWLLEEMNPGRVTYNTPSAHRLRGHLNEAAFERAFAAMVQRQPILRTAIHRERDQVMQVVEPTIEIRLFPAEDLSGLPADEREAALMRRLQELTDTPFDLTCPPLFRARMFRLDANEHVLFFMPHHIIWDGWSFDLLYVELAELYRAFDTGLPPTLPELPVSYGDFAVWYSQWLEGPQFQTQLAFWRERLQQAGEPQSLPTDKPRRPGMSGEGCTEWIRVSRDQTEAMHAVARDADATLNMTLLALYYVLLYERTGQRDLVIGTPVRGRNHAEVESVMGYFTNLVPLHLLMTPETSFVDFVREVKRIVIDSFGNPDVPLEYLQRELKVRYGGNALLYQALFSFQDARQRVADWGGLAHEQVLLFQSGATEDIGLWFLENTKGMIGGVTYNTDVLRADTARMLHKRYLELLARVIADPYQPITALTRIDDVDLAQIQRWNTTAGANIENARIDALFEAQVDRAASAIALTSGSWGTSYAELERRANRVAACLRQRGVGKGIVVALAAEPGVNRIAGLLGILKSGGICLPLDPADPLSRLKACLTDANALVVIGESKLETGLDWPRARALWFDVDIAEIAGTSDARVVAADIDAGEPAVIVYPAKVAEVACAQAFTHRAVVQAIDGLRRAIGIGDEDRILGTAGPDAAESVFQCLLPLINGNEFVLTSRSEVANGKTLSKWLVSSEASVVFATADIWQKMLAIEPTESTRIKAICTGGTPKPQLVEKILARHGQLWNALVTDADIIVSCGRIESLGQGIHGGAPFPGNAIWVIGADGQLLPIGAIGEICVGGICVGQTYGGHQTASIDDFVDAPWSSGKHLLRSGHRGRWLASGHIEELGRLDRRLRIDGRDVEPSVVEAALQTQPNVDRVVVIAREDRDGIAQLVAYVVRMPDSRADVAMLRLALQSCLPAAAIPKHIVMLDELPLFENGDIDIAALPMPTEGASGAGTSDYRPPLGSLERALLDIWCDMLRVRDIGVHDNFFDLGGDSLLAVRVFQRAQEVTGVNLPLATLLRAPTIAGQATAFRAAGAVVRVALITGEAGHDPWAPLVPIQPRGKHPPLFCVHAVGGNVLNYVSLAKALGNDQAFYGVQAIGLDGLTRPLGSLTAMATRYIAEIRKVQAHGPYFLAGGSMGGMIAYEMAHQLRAQGEEIALLALFDTFGPGNRRFEVARAGSIERLGHRWHDRTQRLRKTNSRERWKMLGNALKWRSERIVDMLRARWFRLRGGALPHALRYRVLERSHEQAYYRYDPPPYDGPMVLFRAAEHSEETDLSRTLGWDNIATGGIEVIDLPGSHDTLIEQPELAVALRAVLDRAQARALAAPSGASQD